jgi:hypothetical protein
MRVPYQTAESRQLPAKRRQTRLDDPPTTCPLSRSFARSEGLFREVDRN